MFGIVIVRIYKYCCPMQKDWKQAKRRRKEMKSLKKGAGWCIRILAMLSMLLVFSVPVSAGKAEGADEYEIYPTPQEITYQEGTVSLTDEIKLNIGSGVDTYTQTRIEKTLEVLGLTGSADAGADKTALTVGIYGSGDAADTYARANGAEASLFEESDAYMLYAKGSDIVIVGKNTDAAFYGVTTLKHIFAQLEGKTMRELTIKDYSEVVSRGFIEGYYGNPWSLEDRIDLMQFGGEIKMNQYVYAPKDDPYHNAQWRTLYDDAKLQEIRALAQAGNESKCFFVYALHTFMNNAIRFDTDAHYTEDLNIIKTKFTQVIEAGVRQVGILEDDAAGTSAANIVRLMNDLHDWLLEMKETYPDMRTDILYCPNDYMNYGTQKQKDVNAGVNRDVHIVVTGGKIWGEVSAGFADNFYNGTKSAGVEGRYPYIWVNWPCNDNSKKNLILGGHNSILHAGIDGKKYEGIILNPMQHSEPSKVAIFTAADYGWNVWQNGAEGDQAWDDSFKYIDHLSALDSAESDALREVAKHMIFQGPVQSSGRQVPFEESVELKPLLDAFYAKVEAGTMTQADLDTMHEEFQKIYDAAVLYLEQGQNKRFTKDTQAGQHLKSMRDLMQANLDIVSALEGMLKEDDNGLWLGYSDAQTAYEKSQTYGYSYSTSGTQYAEVGRKYIIPYTEKLLKYLADSVQQILDPEHIKLEKSLIYRVGGTEGSGNAGDAAKAMDGNLNTNYQIQTDQQTGDYVGILFNKLVPVKSIQIALACSGHENDFIPNAVMEYTTDGRTWTAFETQPEAGTTADVSLSFAEMEIKGFRWRGTGIDRGRWLIIREIGYNVEEQPEEPQDLRYPISAVTHTSVWTVASGSSEENLTDGDDSTYAWYDPNQGSGHDSSLAGDFLQVDLGEAKEVYRVRVLVGAEDADKWVKYHMEYSQTGADGSWTALDSYTGTASGTDTYEVNLNGASVRYIKLVSEQNVDKWVKFSEFSVYPYEPPVETLEGVAMDYTNTKNGDWRVEYGNESSRVIPKQSAVLKPGEYIGLKLDRIHDITSVVVTGNNTDKLTLEQSMNQTIWTDTSQRAAARYIRLMNNTDSDIAFDLDSLVVSSSELMPIDYLESTIADSGNADDPRNSGNTRYWFDGDLTTAVKYCVSPQKDQYITYALGQEMSLHSIRVYVLDTDFDYPRDAVIQASADGTEWTDILTIGDGVENNDSDASTKAAENGWTHDTVDVAYSYMENRGFDVTANYIRMKFTANYNHRWIKLNEILLNDGAYFRTINDPTFVTDPIEQKGFAPQNLADNDMTTAFKPNMDGKTEGSLIYRLSESTKIEKINIVQSGSAISNAVVSVRTDASSDSWKRLGILDKSLTSFLTVDTENVYEIKLEWGNVTPVIYEIVTLQYAKDYHKDQIEAARKEVEAAKAAVAEAEKALASAKQKQEEATKKLNAAVTAEEKLKAEVELQQVMAAKAGAEAVMAARQQTLAEKEAVAAKAEAADIRSQAKLASSEEKKLELVSQADGKDQAAAGKLEEANMHKELSEKKDQEKTGHEQNVITKKNELDALLAQQTGGNNNNGNNNNGNNNNGVEKPQPVVTTAVYKNVQYKILNGNKKTAAAYGLKNKKAKSVSVAKSVKIGGVSYKVTQISANAFKNSKKLKNVTIGANVTKIGKKAFYGCKKLRKVIFKGRKAPKIGGQAFKKSGKCKVAVSKIKGKKRTAFLKKLRRAGMKLK